MIAGTSVIELVFKLRPVTVNAEENGLLTSACRRGGQVTVGGGETEMVHVRVPTPPNESVADTVTVDNPTAEGLNETTVLLPVCPLDTAQLKLERVAGDDAAALKVPKKKKIK